MSKLQIETAEVFVPLLSPARYKGAFGGRGSAKSHFFAGLMIEEAAASLGEKGEGLRALCFREVQKTLAQSAKRLLEMKIDEYGLGSQGFKVFKDCIETPGDGVLLFQGMQDHTAESVKSLEGIHVAWGEECQTLSKYSIGLLRPTIRWEDEKRGLSSQLWFSWNPRRKLDAIDRLLRSEVPPTDATVVQSNWRDNPWFPSILEQERIDCLNNDPDQYDNIWEGGYVTVVDGAYFAKHLAKARSEGRIGHVGIDPLQIIRIFVDIGGTSGKSDAFTMWAVQFVGREIRVVDYYEAVGQPIDAHVAWLRKRDFTPDRAKIWLPHDGSKHDNVFKVSYNSGFQECGYKVAIVPNQGAGAASARVEATRRRFPLIWFNEKTCSGGLDALGWYHEKRDETREIGLGPNHDWSSHGADSFGMMCIVYEAPMPEEPLPKYDVYAQVMDGVM